MLRLVTLFILFLLIHSSIFSQPEFSSSNLPIVVINTNGQEIPDDPKIPAIMGIINNGPGIRNNLTDNFNEYNGNIGIEIRGQSSQMFPMKSYSIELRDNQGDDMDQSLFGLPEESDWVMYAPYTDKTFMRNFLAYTLSNDLGHWAAHCRFVEVVLNGNYVGIYVFMEKIKRNSGRVNIKKLTGSNNSGDEVTGGYIFSIDKEADGWFSGYHPNNDPDANIQFSYVYPKIENITTEQKNYIKRYVDSFENALHGNGFMDPQSGYRKYIDENSFIDYFFVNEISRNVDGYRLSSYFYKDRNSISNKIVAGPVWDYDLAFRNANYCDGSNVSGWAYRFNSVCPGDFYQIPFWWDRFMQDTLFQKHLYCRWEEMRTGVLSETHIFHLIDSVYSLVQEAQQRHFQRWPVLGTYVWPNPDPIPTTYQGEIDALKGWIHSRLQWLDDNMPAAGSCTVEPPVIEGTFQLFTTNPVRDFSQASIYSTKDQTITLFMTDAIGRSVMKWSVQLHTGYNNFPSIPTLKTISHGIYFLILSNDNKEKKAHKLLY